MCRFPVLFDFCQFFWSLTKDLTLQSVSNIVETPSHPMTSKIHLHNPEGVSEGCLKGIYFERFRFYIRMICVGNRILRKNLLSLVLIHFHFSRYIFKSTSIAVVAQTFQFSIRNWSEGISWRDSEVSDPLAWESCKSRRIYSILEWKTNPKMVYLSSPSMNFFIANFFRFLR